MPEKHLIKPLQHDGTTRRCGSLYLGEQCLGDHEHGGRQHQSLNHVWPMHLPFEQAAGA